MTTIGTFVLTELCPPRVYLTVAQMRHLWPINEMKRQLSSVLYTPPTATHPPPNPPLLSELCKLLLSLLSLLLLLCLLFTFLNRYIFLRTVALQRELQVSS